MNNNEDTTLGLAFIESNDYVKTLESEKTEFFNEHNQRIYSAMLNLVNENVPVDLLTVSNKLKELGFLNQIGGLEYLAGLVKSI